MTVPPRLIEVKLDPTLRELSEDPSPETDVEKAVWPLLDTAYNLIREAAVRAVFVELRRQATEQGVTLPADEETFRKAKEFGGPASYADLAPDHEVAAEAFHAAYDVLFGVALTEAAKGLNHA